MIHTKKYIAKRLLKSYRIARKQYPPRLARLHAYFMQSGGAVTNLQTRNIKRKYDRRHYDKHLWK